MPKEQERENRRVAFERPLTAQMMAIDGTWRRPCFVKDVSETSATLKVETSIEGLALTEFFLVLSSTGLAYRRCQLDRVNGDELEVSFLRQKAGKKQVRETPA
ncbi:PilZ domain-containing protein [Bradyrhizobium sp. BR 10289]|uniref:PilZ domain-containing protein n=1 Tax=Bradyrhizobium sp. BR 10289 TaxID=2749993 RepID=UPI001C647AC6|nr:PilZ domain-containing protein [Bradyrhizobium sp. BR 10289]MBW7974456.1 PilZ domain-containing protein [Bradyrhizobium sp. BR 10289]